MIMIYGVILFFVGLIQVIGALIRVACAKRQNSTYAIRLKQYLLFVVVFFALNQLLIECNVPEFFIFMYLFLIPPFVAAWYIHHIGSWAKKHKRIKAFDKTQKDKKTIHLQLEVPCRERLELDRIQDKKEAHLSWYTDVNMAR